MPEMAAINDMSIGTQLRQARNARNISVSDAAAATRMKSQHVEALEADDFDRFASPVYARGFLKLYAEYLGLDPAPLLSEYAAARAAAPRPPLLPPTVALPTRRFRTESAEPGVVETRAAPPDAPVTPAPAPAALPEPAVARESPGRSRRALTAAAAVIAAAVAAALFLTTRRSARTPPPDGPADPAPSRAETVSPILELPPEPLADPFAAARPDTAP